MFLGISKKNDHWFYHDLKQNLLIPIAFPDNCQLIERIRKNHFFLCVRGHELAPNKIVKIVEKDSKVHLEVVKIPCEREEKVKCFYRIAPNLLKVVFESKINEALFSYQLFTIDGEQNSPSISLKKFKGKEKASTSSLKRVGDSDLIKGFDEDDNYCFYYWLNQKELKSVEFDTEEREVNGFIQVGPDVFRAFFGDRDLRVHLYLFIPDACRLTRLDIQLDTRLDISYTNEGILDFSINHLNTYLYPYRYAQFLQKKIKYLEKVDLFQIGLSLYHLNRDEKGMELLRIPEKAGEVKGIQELGPFVGIYFKDRFVLFKVELDESGKKTLVSCLDLMKNLDHVSIGDLNLLYFFSDQSCHVYQIISLQSKKLKDVGEIAINQEVCSHSYDLSEIRQKKFFCFKGDPSYYYISKKGSVKKLKKSEIKEIKAMMAELELIVFGQRQ